MKILGILLLTSLTCQAGELVQTEMYCDSTKEIGKTLLDTYGEIPVVTGIASDEAKSLFTIWTNNETKTWTLVATKDETSCIIGVGDKLKVVDYRSKKKT